MNSQINIFIFNNIKQKSSTNGGLWTGVCGEDL
jgi:hypothetical protein